MAWNPIKSQYFMGFFVDIPASIERYEPSCSECGSFVVICFMFFTVFPDVTKENYRSFFYSAFKAAFLKSIFNNPDENKGGFIALLGHLKLPRVIESIDFR